MWMGDGVHNFAYSLRVLYAQLVKQYPDIGWQNSNQTGSIGDAAHQSEGSASDHNPWYQNTVRAEDVANIPKGPDCEAIFQMVNHMYAAKDRRIFPDGYAIFRGRITDPDNPGKSKPYTGSDPHNEHVHVSVSTDQFNSANPWPLNTPSEADMTPAESKMLTDLHDRLARIDLEAFNIDGDAHNPSIRQLFAQVLADNAEIKATLATLVSAEKGGQ